MSRPPTTMGFSGVIYCEKEKCMAWTPEMKIDLTQLGTDTEILNLIGKVLKQLSPMKINYDNNIVTIGAHCVLLESKK